MISIVSKNAQNRWEGKDYQSQSFQENPCLGTVCIMRVLRARTLRTAVICEYVSTRSMLSSIRSHSSLLLAVCSHGVPRLSKNLYRRRSQRQVLNLGQCRWSHHVCMPTHIHIHTHTQVHACYCARLLEDTAHFFNSIL